MQTTAAAPLALIGIGIGKDVFDFVGFDTRGKIAFKRKIKRLALVETFKKIPPCIVGLEACLSAHFVSRTLRALGREPHIIRGAYRILLRRAQTLPAAINPCGRLSTPNSCTLGGKPGGRADRCRHSNANRSPVLIAAEPCGLESPVPQIQQLAGGRKELLARVSKDELVRRALYEMPTA